MTRGESEDDSSYRLFILGAGFSQPAGLPLANELWEEIRKRAEGLRGRAAKFHDDLRDYLEFKLECDGLKTQAEDVDFEDFCRFLDIEHFLGLRGSDTWSRDGNEGTVVIKTLIGEILAERTPLSQDIPELYLNFAEMLRPDDYVLTFNYDVLLERALEAIGKRYRLFPKRYKSVRGQSATVDFSAKEVVILKLHGSIDWFDREEYSLWQREYERLGSSEDPTHPVFNTKDDLGLRKLIEGPRQPDDPLREMYRVRNVETLYEKKNLWPLAVPWLLAPSTMKILYAGKLESFWHGQGSYGGVWNSGLAIIGYSLPTQDDYARQGVYSLVTNYQRHNRIEEVGRNKSRLLLVDRCEGNKQIDSFKANYRFVDWDRAELWTDGLNQNALDFIFEEP